MSESKAAVPIPAPIPPHPGEGASLEALLAYSEACKPIRAAIEVALYERLNQKNGNKSSGVYVHGLGLCLATSSGGCRSCRWVEIDLWEVFVQPMPSQGSDTAKDLWRVLVQPPPPSSPLLSLPSQGSANEELLRAEIRALWADRGTVFDAVGASVESVVGRIHLLNQKIAEKEAELALLLNRRSP